MLDNVKWYLPKVADPQSLGALITWLEPFPAKKPYCYTDSGKCLAAQYNKSIGRPYASTHLTPFDCDLELIALEEPHTFGAALERARSRQPHND